MDASDYSVQGFRASAVSAGFKKNDSLDIALIVSDVEAVAAGVFTTNRVQAAPVVISRNHVANGTASAVVANAGNANACTGKRGLDDARLCAGLVGNALGIESDNVLVASTGVIGLPLKMDAYSDAVPRLVKSLSPEGIPLAARAIMTTDSFVKLSRFDGKAGGKDYRIIGFAKGAGMIMPNMATMLCFILSDIGIKAVDLKRALMFSTAGSFNRISVDGDTSTNDMVLVMANGKAGNGRVSPEDYDSFAEGLTRVMTELAVMIVKDGEGATKLVHVEIKGAATEGDALIAARTVSNSSLVKTAFFGQDPNWGRIMAALGRSGIKMNEESVNIWIDDIMIVENGLGRGSDFEKKAAERMKQAEFSLVVDLQEGTYADRMTTCDLTHEYISINADYRT